jgi:hypothetical protein
MNSDSHQNTEYPVIDAIVAPKIHLNTLTKREVSRLLNTSRGDLHELFRKCALAVLNCGNYIHDSKELLNRYPSFEIEVIKEERGIKLALKNAPAIAFVGDKMIRGISEHLFAVLRDIVYVRDEIRDNPKFDIESSAGITDAVFHIPNINAMVPPLIPGTTSAAPIPNPLAIILKVAFNDRSRRCHRKYL